MHTIRMIINPQADRGRSYQMAGDLRQLAMELGGADWAGTEYPGHAAELALAAAQAGYQTVVALGGDGTVHEVMNGLMQSEPSRRPCMGVVPTGSGNDFAGGIGIPKDPLRAVQRLFRGGEEKTIDVGRIRDASGREEFFCNVLGIGFDAAINVQSRRITWLHGFPMYLVATLWTILHKYEKPMLQIEMDGRSFSGRHLMFTICNGTREGGGFKVTPDGRMDDGEMDYLLVDAMSRLRMMRLIPEVMNGTHGRFPEAHLGRMRKLRLTSDMALPVHADGEMYASYQADIRAVDIEILPRALRVLV
jgi:diacylglycerol kinase (ATP)